MTGAFRRIARVLARPLRGDRKGGLAIQTYRGFASRERAFVMGRVLRQPYFGIGARGGALERDLLNLVRRFFRRGAGAVPLKATFAGSTLRVQSDRDGFFSVDLRFTKPLPDDGVWHSMHLEVDGPDAAETTADVYVAPETARFAVISDIDDTVVFTGVANKLMMLWRLFVAGANSRVAFPGVASFYAGLHAGPSGADGNPMLYVSRGPWSLYEVLEAFFDEHRIPNGPVLFLRHWGLTLQSPLPRRSSGHKLELIRIMFSIYADLPFVLIGDSGQHDPEIYSRLVREHPDRVRAIYIRDVSRNPQRTGAIEQLTHDVTDQGSSLLLAADSFIMATHAAEHGLIERGALAAVLAEKDTQDPQAKGDIRLQRND